MRGAANETHHREKLLPRPSSNPNGLSNGKCVCSYRTGYRLDPCGSYPSGSSTLAPMYMGRPQYDDNRSLLILTCFTCALSDGFPC